MVFIEEEVYVEQPPEFVDPTHLDFVFKLEKALYGLKQAPKAWYKRLSTFLILNGFVKGKVDATLFMKHVNDSFLKVQIYVNDIIFGSTNENLCKDFESCMKKEFEMSMMGESAITLDFKLRKRVMRSSSIKPSI